MTNPLHYPNLERCIKLTEIGFPETEKEYTRVSGGFVTGPKAGEKFQFKIANRPLQGDLICAVCTEDYCCPSVMEMLDVIPEKTESLGVFSIVGKNMAYFDGDSGGKFLDSSIPNALAEMILWLVEEEHLSFNK